MQSNNTNFSEADTKERSSTDMLLDRIEKLTSQIESNERTDRIQRALFKIARTTTTAESMDAFYRSIHEIVAELTSIDAVIIALYHEAEDCLSFDYYFDQFDDVQQSEDSPLNNRGLIPVEKCKDMLTWKVIASNKVTRSTANTKTTAEGYGKECQDWIGIPLRREGKPIGVFSIQSYQSGFEYRDEEIDLMVFISRHIASALQQISDRDSLRTANEELKQSSIQLEEANRQLKIEIEERELISKRMMALSHEAGRAEIATGILHNIGNVLNSINVSAGIAEETLRRSRIGSLGNAADLLQKQDDLGEFFSNDKRGQTFPKYLSELSKVLADEQKTMKTELQTLSSHLEHVKTVVSMQQTYAGMSGLSERVSIPELLSDAELLISCSLTRHRVEVIRDFEDMPRVMLEKQKLLQVIVNLLKNAKDSMTAGRSDGRKLIIRVARVQNDPTQDESLPAESLQIEFIDNGQGIAKENLTKIFSHGFTTKHDGHGFGLHSCANATQEMNGKISVQSKGPGTGATFILQLPYVTEGSER